jgi:hypothetical protein
MALPSDGVVPFADPSAGAGVHQNVAAAAEVVGWTRWDL